MVRADALRLALPASRTSNAKVLGRGEHHALVAADDGSDGVAREREAGLAGGWSSPPPPSSAGSAYPDRESRLAGNPRLLPSMKPSRFFFLLLLLLEFDLCYNLPWYIDSENV